MFPPIITMLHTTRASEDGFVVKSLEEGKTYWLGEALVADLIRDENARPATMHEAAWFVHRTGEAGLRECVA